MVRHAYKWYQWKKEHQPSLISRVLFKPLTMVKPFVKLLLKPVVWFVKLIF